MKAKGGQEDVAERDNVKLWACECGCVDAVVGEFLATFLVI